MLLASCGSNNSNFYADCSGKIVTYSNGIQTVEKETRRYEFSDNKLVGRECSLNKRIIFCYSEVAGSDSKSKKQFVFDKSYYTLTDIQTTIESTKSTGLSFVKSEIFQATCLMTIISGK
jgi:hypothetical protein